jgi:hypothetical protein
MFRRRSQSNAAEVVKVRKPTKSDVSAPSSSSQLVAYWDALTDAVWRGSQQLQGLAQDDRASALSGITQDVERWTGALSDDDLAQLASVAADDLYKAASTIELVDEFVFQYLTASAGTFFGLLRQRGYLLHYIVENTFPGLQRPLEVFRPWFNSTTIVYICPQFLAAELMKADGLMVDGVDSSVVGQHLPKYIGEARHLAGGMVERCTAEGRHFLFLDTDPAEDSFDAALASQALPGVISVIRNEAPVPGSKVRVLLPPARLSG